jgi:ComF family protein
LWRSLDWLYPPRCGGCEKLGSRWCIDCQREASLIAPPICACCGEMMTHAGVCPICQKRRPDYTALRSWAVFDGPVKNALHRLKYRRDVALGEALAVHLVACLSSLNWHVDIVVPVPLGVARRAQRGYNQAALLAKPLALACEMPYQPDALIKARETISQVGLSVDQRWNNVHGSFSAHEPTVRSRTILLVDDVATSGATLSACAVALRAAGAKDVYALTLARA